jgi:hypothetical protein
MPGRRVLIVVLVSEESSTQEQKAEAERRADKKKEIRLCGIERRASGRPQDIKVL